MVLSIFLTHRSIIYPLQLTDYGQLAKIRMLVYYNDLLLQFMYKINLFNFVYRRNYEDKIDRTFRD